MYVRRSEKGVQSPGETLRRRSGSCRDFAVLMMEAARSLGLAARFVSGYIFVPEANQAASVGGGSTHGWMQVYLPGAGWIDFDPTNSIVGNRNLIRVAVAWDQQSALPLWGTFHGPASSFRGMDVDVSPLPPHGRHGGNHRCLWRHASTAAFRRTFAQPRVAVRRLPRRAVRSADRQLVPRDLSAEQPQPWHGARRCLSFRLAGVSEETGVVRETLRSAGDTQP